MTRAVAVVLVALFVLGCGGSSPVPSPTNAMCPRPAIVPFPQTAWPCPPAAAMAAIDAVITLEFLDDPTAGTLVCHAADGSRDLTRLQERAYQSLYLLQRVTVDTPWPWTTDSLWTWFTSQIHRIQFVALGSRINGRCCGVPGVMQLNSAYNQSEAGFPNMASVMVHEARHADGQHPHSCGEGDATVTELGAYGVQYYFEVWLAEHLITPTLTPDERAALRNSAEVMRTAGVDFCAACGGI